MNLTSFEDLHRGEARHAEWFMLDEALAQRTINSAGNRHSLRVALGRSMIRLGTRLAGDQCVPWTEPNDHGRSFV